MKVPVRIIIGLFASSLFAIAAVAQPPIPGQVNLIGVILPLTGEYASWGQSIRRTFELLAPQFEKQFAFQFEDEGNCEPTKSVTAFQKLKSNDIQFMFLGCLAGTKAILPIANKSDVLLFSLGLVDDAAFKQSTKLINLATQLSTESGYLGKHVLSKNPKSVAIIHWQDAFSEEFATTLEKTLRSGGVETVSQHPVESMGNDFRSVLLRIKADHPDAICENVGEQQQSILLRQIREIGITAPVFSNYAFEAAPTLLAAGKFAEGIEYTFPLNSAEGTAPKIAFDKKFAEQFGGDAIPTPNSYFARDGIFLLNEAIQDLTSNPIEIKFTEKVAKYLLSLRHYEGLSGEISFLPDGSNIRPYGIKKIENGKPIWIEKSIKR